MTLQNGNHGNDEIREVYADMSNKTAGNAFEREFCDILSHNGFWAHILQDNRNGQPFDIISAKDGNTLVFDCKVCEAGRFYLSRMEGNQISAMERWEACGNGEGAFAIKFLRTGNIYIVLFRELMKAREAGIRSLSESSLKKRSIKEFVRDGTDDQ